MKKTISIIFIILSIFTLSISVFATGNGNVDSGGGGGTTGGGTSQNKWRMGDDGVRISIVDTKTNTVVRTPIDFSNKNRSDIKYDFGKVSKIQYKNGVNLAPKVNKYKSSIPDIKMPTIVSDKGNDIQAIKKYFTSEWTVRRIAEKSAIPYETLINGQYKLLLEPIFYITYRGNRWAMTAHETALYNEKTNGDIRRYLLVYLIGHYHFQCF